MSDASNPGNITFFRIWAHTCNFVSRVVVHLISFLLPFGCYSCETLKCIRFLSNEKKKQNFPVAQSANGHGQLSNSIVFSVAFVWVFFGFFLHPELCTSSDIGWDFVRFPIGICLKNKEKNKQVSNIWLDTFLNSLQCAIKWLKPLCNSSYEKKIKGKTAMTIYSLDHFVMKWNYEFIHKINIKVLLIIPKSSKDWWEENKCETFKMHLASWATAQFVIDWQLNHCQGFVILDLCAV